MRRIDDNILDKKNGTTRTASSSWTTRMMMTRQRFRRHDGGADDRVRRTTIIVLVVVAVSLAVTIGCDGFSLSNTQRRVRTTRGLTAQGACLTQHTWNQSQQLHRYDSSANWMSRAIASTTRLNAGKDPGDEKTGAGATTGSSESDGGGAGGIFDFLFNPYESKIPKEIEKEIYEAEGNTAAAKDRTKRVIGYTVLAFLGVLGAFFNGFLTELRSSTNPETGIPFILEESSFAWVQSNGLFSFLFLNKIGGALSLLIGGGSGLLAEAEFDSRRINAERIYEELQRRRSEAASPDGRKNKSPNKSGGGGNKKRRFKGKESKRLGALSEVITVEQPESDKANDKTCEQSIESSSPGGVSDEAKGSNEAKKKDSSSSGGILGGIKDLYDRADKMAQTQALLLNKKLEDEGVIEKITDESGLRVIGKDAASKLAAEAAQKEEQQQSSTQQRKE